MLAACAIALPALADGDERDVAAQNASAAAPAPAILVLGDSLSAAYGVPLQQGWVALLQQRLKERGYPDQVINASVSGETSAGGLRRLPDLLDRHHPQFVLIELGANDGLRGLPLPQLRANLRRMAAAAIDAGAQPVLFEMYIPTNYGVDYADGFRASFQQLADEMQLPLVPFFLGAIATDPGAFQDDGIHPNLASQPKLLDAVWPTLEPLLKP
jgi:acyl-CoA thioesterase-1